MTRHRRFRKGLTLLELLAAVIVFSMVAAAGVSVVREATSSGDAWRHSSRALDVLEEWRREHEQGASQDEVPIEWLTTEVSGVRWRVLTSDVFDEEQPHAESRDLQVAVLRVVVERTDVNGHTEIVHESHLFRAPPEDDTTGGAP